MGFDSPTEGFTAPGVRLPPEPSSDVPLQRLAQEAEYSEKVEEIERRIHRVVALVDAGLYKRVRVNMRGVNGNAFNIIAVVNKALVRAGAPVEHRAIFKTWCMSGDYENLLRVCARWVTIVDEAEERGSALDAFSRIGV